MKHRNKTSQQPARKSYLLSNISMNARLVVTCILALLPSVLLFAIVMNRVDSAETSRKRKTEQTITAVAQQYMDTSVENIVSIAKTIYTNSALYNFLNTAYSNTGLYYDAFYRLRDNNSLIIAENSNIQSFTVYSDNPTILSGGNIGSLGGVKKEQWYLEFQRLDKNMVLYCDTATQTLSLIRRLDYYSVDTGDCIMKIDFNSAPLQASFQRLNFDGNLYVMSSGVLFYANTAGVRQSDIKIDSGYSCVTKNYYTVEIEFYAKANKETMLGLIKHNLMFGVPFFVFCILSVLVAFLLMRNVTSRVNRLSGCYSTVGSFNELKDDRPGKDEIGKLYGCCIDMSYQLERMLHEGIALDEQLERFRDENNALLLQTLHQDALLAYRMVYAECAIPPPEEPDIPVMLSEELKRLEDCMALRQSAAEGKLSFRLDTEPTGQTKILPLSLVMLVHEVLNQAQKEEEAVSLTLTVTLRVDALVISLCSSEAQIAASRLLKLRAIFEGERKTASWGFQPGYPYNPYLRLKEFYRSDLECLIEASPTLRLTLALRRTDNIN